MLKQPRDMILISKIDAQDIQLLKRESMLVMCSKNMTQILSSQSLSSRFALIPTLSAVSNGALRDTQGILGLFVLSLHVWVQGPSRLPLLLSLSVLSTCAIVFLSHQLFNSAVYSYIFPRHFPSLPMNESLSLSPGPFSPTF